uniref:Reverse transcriptase domain-containing protein n=1 Tax=Nothobranchius korthausae TaxID=1143690 RepID=A0A1A8GMK6_9TELE
MTKRHISNNIRLVLDILDYSDLILDDSFILFLDFYKAFDSIEHEFIFLSLKKFGLGDFFCNAIKTLYSGANSSIRMKNGTTSRFCLNRGVRQGCPISPYLFLLCTQILASYIANSPMKGINIADREVVISQLADDTTIFLKNANQVSIALKIIDDFSKASGLILNLNKCQLLPINNCNDQSICNIAIQHEVTYLGLIICKDQKTRITSNFSPIIKKTQSKLNQWLQRDLSLRGRVLLSKAEGLSRLTYAAISLHVDNKTCGEIDRMLFNFLWKNKTHYIRKSVIMNDYQHGGLNILDFTTLNNTFKINWAKHFLKNPVSIWNFIPHYIFSKFGGLTFILGCDYNVGKLPEKLSMFHKQVLLAWSLIYKHNFTPHTYLIWNNRNIVYKNKSLFFSNWVEKQIIFVNQLYNTNGELMSYTELLNTYKVPATPKEYAILFAAIPMGVRMLFKGVLPVVPPISPPDPVNTYVGKVCLIEHKNSNRNIRALFQRESLSVPYVIFYWNSFVTDISWKRVWTIPNKYFVTNKVKEVSFKILHKCYPANHYMTKFKRDIDVNCCFCGSHPETVQHLFWICSHATTFWKDFSRFIIGQLYKDFILKWENVVFCFFRKHRKEDVYFVINLLIILDKFYLHKCKYSNQKPNFKHYYNDTLSYIKLISGSLNKKALKTITICTTYNLFGCV